MKHGVRSVSIGRLPDQIDRVQRETIYSELESCINVDRPAVVLDCSAIRILDKPALHLLLCCLEEAMKRNGDIRLAALRPEARSILKFSGVDSLFYCFETVAEAVESFDRPQSEVASLTRQPACEQQSDVNAA